MGAAEALARVADTDRYPLTDPDGPGWKAVVSRTRDALAESGCSVLPDFIRPALQEALQRGVRARSRRTPTTTSRR